jgi:urea transport system permease protein
MPSMRRPWPFSLWPLILWAGVLAPATEALGAAPQESAPSNVMRCLDSLALSVEGKPAAVECLIAASNASADTAFKPLLTAIANGGVFVTRLPDKPHALVIPGEEFDKDEVYYRPAYLAYPYAELRGADGKPLLIPSDSLVELEVGRVERGLVQPVLTAFELKSSDPVRRRGAAQLVGETRDVTQLPALRIAAAAEKDKRIKQVMDESLARLELSSTDLALRIAAAEKLGDLKGLASLSDLEAIAADPGEPADLRDAAAASVKSIKAWSQFTGILQNVFSGLSLGSILILMALGLAVIFGLMGVINMAHGEFMMIGAYATFLVQVMFQSWFPGAAGWFLAFSFPAAFLAAGLAGMLIEATIIKRLYGRPLETLLATWGVSLLLIQIARTIFGDLTAVTTPPFLGGGWEVFPAVVFPYNRLFIIVLTALIVTGMTVLFFKTTLGMKVRAVTQNRAMSACLGVRTRRLDNITFGIGTGIAGVAGCALTQIGNVDPGMGQNYIVDSFMVVVTGGVGKLVGTVLAGLGIGTLNKFLEPVFEAVYAKVILLGLVILFLQWRPSGLFPAKGRHEDN